MTIILSILSLLEEMRQKGYNGVSSQIISVAAVATTISMDDVLHFLRRCSPFRLHAVKPQTLQRVRSLLVETCCTSMPAFALFAPGSWSYGIPRGAVELVELMDLGQGAS